MRPCVCLTWLPTHVMKPSGTPPRESHLQHVPHSSPTRLARSSAERQSEGRACSLHPRRDISGDLIPLSLCPSALHSTLERDLPLSPLHSSWQNFKEMGLLTLAVKGHVRPCLWFYFFHSRQKKTEVQTNPPQIPMSGYEKDILLDMVMVMHARHPRLEKLRQEDYWVDLK